MLKNIVLDLLLKCFKANDDNLPLQMNFFIFTVRNY